MLNSDLSTDPFLDHGDINYVNKLQQIQDTQNKFINEIIEAQDIMNASTLAEMFDAYLVDIISNRIIGDGTTVSTSYNEETGILTISKIE